MNAQHLIESLERFGNILPVVVHGVASDHARWKPPDGAWSILEVLSHLADEEVEDFRQRLDLTLRDATGPWPPIDPEAWAIERCYNEGDLQEALTRFTTARGVSVEWLRSLEEPDWSKAYNHPKAGPIRAGDILVSWAAHDWLHLRQITKRMFQMTQRDGGQYKTDYAGDWTA